MPRKIDPLNKKLYGSVTAMLTVTDVKAAADFYQKAFGFANRGIMNGPDGKAIHAELTLRGTTLMLGPEMPQMGARGAKTIGASPTSLYLLTENIDKVVAKAVKLGATAKGPVMDMFWGDRCGTVVDPEGYIWMVATRGCGSVCHRQSKISAAYSLNSWTQKADIASSAVCSCTSKEPFWRSYDLVFNTSSSLSRSKPIITSSPATVTGVVMYRNFRRSAKAVSSAVTSRSTKSILFWERNSFTRPQNIQPG